LMLLYHCMTLLTWSLKKSGKANYMTTYDRVQIGYISSRFLTAKIVQ